MQSKFRFASIDWVLFARTLGRDSAIGARTGWNASSTAICIANLQGEARNVGWSCPHEIKPTWATLGTEGAIRAPTHAFTNHVVWWLEICTATGLGKLATTTPAQDWLLRWSWCQFCAAGRAEVFFTRTLTDVDILCAVGHRS
jgi:hypothetical protein